MTDKLSDRERLRDRFAGDAWHGKSAADKQRALWQACVSELVPLPQPPAHPTGLPLAATLTDADRDVLSPLADGPAMVGAFGLDIARPTRPCSHAKRARKQRWRDTLWGARVKVLHRVGVVTLVKFTARGVEAGPWSQDWLGLMRVSDGRVARASERGYVQVGIGLKILRNGQPSLDYVFGGEVRVVEGDAKAEPGVFHHIIGSQLPRPPPPKEGDPDTAAVGQEVASVFLASAAELDDPLGLDPFDLRQRLLDQSVQSAPLWLVPTDAARDLNRHATRFRHDLVQLKPTGVAVYEVILAENKPTGGPGHLDPGAAWLGTLTLQSAFVASRFGDEDLWFRHPLPLKTV